MATGPTFSFGSGSSVGRFTGFFNETAIPGFPPNSNDLSDIPVSNAALEEGCPCDITKTQYGDLDCAVSYDEKTTFLFQKKKVQRFVPTDIPQNSTDKCKFFPVDTNESTISYHFLTEGNTMTQLSEMRDDPSRTHDRIDIREVPTSTTALGKLQSIGYQKLVGDNPGYSNGKYISYISGMIHNGLVKEENVIISYQPKFEVKTATNKAKYVEIKDVSGVYIKELILYVTSPTDRAGRQTVDDGSMYIFFKYNAQKDKCGVENIKISKILGKESVIDNISTLGVKKDGSGRSYISIECGYATGDIIEIWGNFSSTITSVQIKYMTPTVYLSTIIKTDNFSSCFDNNGRLFVFYEDEINYTELPYEVIECKEPAPPVVPVPSPSPPPVTTGGGIGGATSGGGGGGSGGSGGGGGGGGGGIPGVPPTTVRYSSSSSSSSIAVQISSSSSTATAGSSSSIADTTPPPVPANGKAVVQIDSKGGTVVILSFEDGNTTAGSTTNSSDTAKYNIYRANELEGPYKKIGESPTTSFTDTSPVDNTWNYYRVTAVDKAGNESAYILIKIFVVKPKQCENPDCAGCGTRKNKSVFKVFFSSFTAKQLTFQCNKCYPADTDAFVRILNDAFYEDARDSDGNKVIKKFCLLKSCDDANVLNECRWTNTFYVPALIYNCLGFDCSTSSRKPFEKVLIPLTINLVQNKLNGWKLEAYAVSPDCRRMPLFESDWTLSACNQPERFLNKIENNEKLASGTNNVLRSTSACGLYPSDTYLQNTGTISAAMTPDQGLTWFKFHGLITITQDRKAIKPVVTYDKHSDTIHLTYIERDATNDANTSTVTTGFDAFLIHTRFNSDDFKTEDAFKLYLPAPASTSETVDPVIPVVNNVQQFSVFSKAQLKQFTIFGQKIRTSPKDVMIYEEHLGNDASAAAYAKTAPAISYRDKNGKWVSTSHRITITEETYSSFISDQGKLFFVRNGVSGTLVDPPERLTRRRRKKAQCGNYTWSVAGITDTSCGCQSLIGTFPLELNSKTGDYEDYKWTLTVSSDYKYWEMYADEPGGSNALVFRKKRGLNLCPPTGTYQMICSKCLGNITGTLDVQRMGVYGDGVLINSIDLPASQINKTDFSYVPAGSSKEQRFVIKNTTTKRINLTGNPRIAIVGPNANEFSVTSTVIGNLDPRDGSGVAFVVRFTPNPTNCKDINNAANIRRAQVRIATDSPDYGTYFFNISGQCIPAASNSTPGVVSSTNGIVFSADAVGTVYRSADIGTSWETAPHSIKTGQYARTVYETKSSAFYNFYVTDDMLFVRRYPGLFYTKVDDPKSDLSDAFDGVNIIKTPEVLIPNTDVFQFGVPTSVLEFMSLPNFFGLPNVNIPGSILDTFEEDLRSKKTVLVDEMDIRGIPIFLSGNKQGTLINCYYPYDDNYTFDDKMSVASVRPTAYISANGMIRFFYIDLNGNINGGSLGGPNARLDTKLGV